jgi:tol-pal system protein YbgF
MRRSTLILSLSAVGILAAALTAPAWAQSGQSALNSEMRMSAMEDQMRDLNGRVEELNNTVSQLKQQLDRLSSDIDVRFSQMGQGGSPSPADQAPSLTPPPGPSAAIAPLPPQPKPSQGAGDMSQAPSASGNLGTLSSGGGQAVAALPPGSVQGSAQDQYNYAMGLLTQANYPAAEQAMRGFVQHFPADPLAGNAQYWLGETFYVRKDYASAATAFAQGYEKYPKGPKAADDLLKLGMSLTALNQKADACRSYQRLEHDFPVVPQTVKERLGAEKQRAGCA